MHIELGGVKRDIFETVFEGRKPVNAQTIRIAWACSRSR
jgi:hypothetical protein